MVIWSSTTTIAAMTMNARAPMEGARTLEAPLDPDRSRPLPEGAGLVSLPDMGSGLGLHIGKIHLRQGTAATRADGRMIGNAAHAVIMHPAALALLTFGRRHLHPKALHFLGLIGIGQLTFGHRGARDDQDAAQVGLEFGHHRVEVVGKAHGHRGIQAVADDLVAAGLFQGLGHLGAHLDQGFPFGGQGFVAQGRVWLGKAYQVNALGLVRDSRQVGPDLFRGKGHDRRHDACHGIQNGVHGRLGATPRQGCRRAGVEPVLEDIQVEGGEIHGTVVIQAVVDHMELIGVIRLEGTLDHPLEFVQGEAVDIQHLVNRHGVLLGIEIVQVAQDEPAGVTDPAIGVAELLEDVVRNAHIIAVVRGRHPHAQDLGAVLVDDRLGRHHVAQGFGHLLTLGVDHEPVGQDGLVGGLLASAHGGQKGAVEPAAMLVAALQIEVGRPCQVIAVLQYGSLADARIEPDVEDVVLFGKTGVAAVRADRVLGHQFGNRFLEPHVGPVGGELIENMVHGGLVHVHGVALLADEDRDRHPPGPLAGNAPVRPIFDHAVDALAAPVGNPLHAVDLFQGFFAQPGLLHGDEPLGRGAEDHRPLAAPAVGIAVPDIGLGQQHALVGQGLIDGRVGLENELTGEQPHLIGEHAVVVDRRVGVQAVLQAHVVIFAAVSRSGVHAAGAGFQGNVVAEDDQRVAIVKRMLAAFVFQDIGLEFGHDFVVGDAEGLHAGLDQLAGQDQHLSAGNGHGGIIEIRVQGHGQVGRQGPGCGGPDHHGHLSSGQTRVDLGRVIFQGKLDIHRRRGLVVIFDLGFGQGRFAVAAPVDRFLAAEKAALQGELAALPGDDRLITVIHGQVGVVPLAHDAQALEFLTLDVDELLGVGPALAAHLGLGHLLLLGAQFLVHVVFDGQAVAVPARHVGGIEPGHLPGADDDILENLVQRRADMNMAVGIGRTVVQDKSRPTFGRLADALVQLGAFPGAELFGLLLGKVGFHGKAGMGKIQGLLVIHRCLRSGIFLINRDFYFERRLLSSQ
ncbi:hypothetical protein DESC_70002 [Desulfosarcina cetonica]|nr:hypothetical protein DESC_70002 [Desulfosarcina cetonica]